MRTRAEQIVDVWPTVRPSGGLGPELPVEM
jgi:hypothetical protein